MIVQKSHNGLKHYDRKILWTRFLTTLLVLLMILVICPLTTFADDIGSIGHPATTGEELKAAILSAQKGDTVYITSMALSSQVYFENGYGGGDEIDVIIASADGSDAVIDASQNPTPYYSFNFHGIKTVTLTFENVIIDGGGTAGSIRFSRGGGGLPQADRILTLNNAVMQNCMGQNNGGAVHVDWDNIVANNCIFTNNSTTGHGGAIFVREGDATINECTFINNNAFYSGGAVSMQTKGNYYGDTTITGCTFTGNSCSDGFGGGLYASGKIIIDNSVFDRNSAICGGGIANYNYSVTIANSVLSGNMATVTEEKVQSNVEQFAGMYDSPQELGLNYDTWLDYCSYAYGGGGGIYSTGTVDVTNTNVTNNVSGYNGGGIWVDNLETLTVSEDVTFSGNTATTAWYMSDENDIQMHETNILEQSRSDPPEKKPAFIYTYNNYDIVYLKGDVSNNVRDLAAPTDPTVTPTPTPALESGTGSPTITPTPKPETGSPTGTPTPKPGTGTPTPGPDAKKSTLQRPSSSRSLSNTPIGYKTVSRPKTGDNSSIAYLVLILAASGALIVIIIGKKKRKKT